MKPNNQYQLSKRELQFMLRIHNEKLIIPDNLQNRLLNMGVSDVSIGIPQILIECDKIRKNAKLNHKIIK